MQPSDDRVIDLWGFVTQLWRSRWVWLLIFALVAASGGAYAMLRPSTFIATQKVFLAPAVTGGGEAEAIQQQTFSSSMVLTIVDLALDPRVAEPLSGTYEELADPRALPQIAQAELKSINLLNISVRGKDGARAAAMAADVAVSLAENLEALTPQVEPHLRPAIIPVGTPLIEAEGAGRPVLLSITALAAVAIASAATAAWQRLRRGR